MSNEITIRRLNQLRLSALDQAHAQSFAASTARAEAERAELKAIALRKEAAQHQAAIQELGGAVDDWTPIIQRGPDRDHSIEIHHTDVGPKCPKCAEPIVDVRHASGEPEFRCARGCE